MKMQRSVIGAFLATLGFLIAGGGARAEPPAVVASIKPVHSLVAAVMEGVGEPELLVEGAGSPHSYSLRPSQARALSRARVIFWVGEGLESFLIKPLAALPQEAEVVALGEVAGLTLMPTREGGMWEADMHGDEAEHEHEHGEVDMHLWLDPRNAAAMVDAIAAALSAADPEHAATYRANAAETKDELSALDAALRAKLAPVRDRPFVVFHDAYQYFENRYGVNAVGSITVDPQRAPGAGRLSEIRAELAALDAACVFAEPQFEPALVETVVEDTHASKAVLDPLGADLDAGPQQYVRLMSGLADSLVGCLGRARSG